jgi:hypothetical protein
MHTFGPICWEIIVICQNAFIKILLKNRQRKYKELWSFQRKQLMSSCVTRWMLFVINLMGKIKEKLWFKFEFKLWAYIYFLEIFGCFFINTDWLRYRGRSRSQFRLWKKYVTLQGVTEVHHTPGCDKSRSHLREGFRN